MSTGDMERRIDRLEDALGDGEDPDAAYRPNYILPIAFTRHWHVSGAQGLASNGEDESGDGLDEGRREPYLPESVEVKREAALRREATVDQIVAWVTEDAHRRNYRQPYQLFVIFLDADDVPEHATFTVPWRKPQGGFWSDHRIHWPIVGPIEE